MKIAANVKALAALRPRAERYDVAVNGRRGLVVRVWPSGRVSLLHRFKVKGEPFRMTLGDFRAESLETLFATHARQRHMLARGENPAAEAQRADAQARSAPTIARLAERYLDEHARPKKRSAHIDAQVIARDVLPRWGKLQAKEIGFAEVDSLIESIRRDPKRGATAPRATLAIVRKMFAFAVKKRLMPMNPARGVEVPAPPQPRDRALSDAELRALLKNLPGAPLLPAIRNALRVQLLTGARIGEVLGIVRGELDFDAKLWKLPAGRSKNKLPNILPLTSAAALILRGLTARSQLAFPGAVPGQSLRVDSVAKALARAQVALSKPGAAVGKFTTHDLRRTVETGLARLGIGREVRDRVLNHKDNTIGGRHYNTHDYLPEKAAALAAWERKLGLLAKGGRGAVVPLVRKQRSRA